MSKPIAVGLESLNEDQREVIVAQQIPLDRVFDASGLATREWKSLMSFEQLWIAFGVSPCRKAAHTLRTRGGHCVQRDPAKLSYLRRHDESAEIYVAESKASNLVKIGIAKSSVLRVAQLNSELYGLTCDWQLKFAQVAGRAGKLETLVHMLLAEQKAEAQYVKNGRVTPCREVFRCSANSAIELVKLVLSSK